MKLAREGDGGGAEVDDAASSAHGKGGTHGADFVHAGKRKEHRVAALADFGHGLRRFNAQPGERRGVDVVAENRLAALRREVAAHRLAHHAQTDEADHACLHTTSASTATTPSTLMRIGFTSASSMASTDASAESADTARASACTSPRGRLRKPRIAANPFTCSIISIPSSTLTGAMRST